MSPDQRRQMREKRSGASGVLRTQQRIEALATLIDLARNSDDQVVRLMAATRACNQLMGKPRRQRRESANVTAVRDVVIGPDKAAAEPALEHNGGPPLGT